MSKVTKKSILELLSLGFSVRAVAHNMPTVEDIPAMRKELQEFVDAHNKTHGDSLELIESDLDFWIGTRVWLKPGIRKQRFGEIKVLSKECAFTWKNDNGRALTSFFKIKDIQVIDANSFYVNTGFLKKPDPEATRIEYEIIV